MPFERFKKGKPCQICGTVIDIVQAQKYCLACTEAAACMHRVNRHRRQKKAWNDLSSKEQLRRMDLAAKKILDDPSIKRRTKCETKQ